jgi:hypothetical protein
MASKETLHRLVDELPETEVSVAERFLAALLQPNAMARVLESAAEDDEVSTGEEDSEADEAWQQYLRGEGLSAEEAKRRLLS